MNKQMFLDKSLNSISNIYDTIYNQNSINLLSYKPNETAIIIIDMLNGFVKCGNLKNGRNIEINDKIANFLKKVTELKIPKVFLADSHTDASTEFSSFPSHCVKNTFEAQVTKEIAEINDYHFIEKNSTNGFFAPGFISWLKNNKHINNFIVIGVCTDICIQQFCLTLKAYFNQINIQKSVFVPIDLVETYTDELRDAGLANLMSLYNMYINGIKIVSEIEY